MTIAEVAKRCDTTADTLRYYERVGLLPQIRRSGGGIRVYTEADCNWVEFIRCMRSAGMPVEALVDYVALFAKGDETVSARKALLTRQRDLLDERIRQMEDVLTRLNFKIEHYDTMVEKENKLINKEKDNG